MFIKIIAVISIIIIYLTIFGLFVTSFREQFKCQETFSCIRFCSTDAEEYSDDFLANGFINSESGKEWLIDRDFHEIEIDGVKVYRGAPICGGLSHLPSRNESTFKTSIYGFNFRGVFTIGEKKYDYNRYCIEKSENNEEDWKVMLCNQDVQYHRIFHLTIIFFSILLFGSTIFVYAWFKELRDFHGKTIISFLVTLISAYATVPFLVFRVPDKNTDAIYMQIIFSSFLLAMIQILMWITAMIVHSFLTFKNFKNQTSKHHDFSIYAVFVVTFSAFSAVVMAYDSYSGEDAFFHLIFLYLFIAALDVFFLIITGVKIFILSRHLTHSEQSSFDFERKWFWTTVNLSLIMLVTWPTQVYVWKMNFKLYNMVLSDCIILLTAVTIFVILIGKKKIRVLLFKKYRGITNS